MVWSIIKAIYGYLLPVPEKDDPDDEIEIEQDFPELKGLKYNYTLDIYNRMKRSGHTPLYVSGEGIAASKNGGKDKDETFDYCIKEFIPYTGRNGLVHYDLIHEFRCCSDSNKQFIVIGVTYDEIHRNLFLGDKFDDECNMVFNNPTLISDINDNLFQHDSKQLIDLNQTTNFKKVSNPNERKLELLKVEETKKLFVDKLADKYPFLKDKKLGSFLMLDDCTFCT